MAASASEWPLEYLVSSPTHAPSDSPAAARQHLPRLLPEHYRGRAFVHWVLSVSERKTGWLSRDFHAAWSITLLHACARYRLVCPAYVLMPDHAHLLLTGLRDGGSDQRVAVTFLQKNTSQQIAPAEWDRQPYDHVLREHERAQGAFDSVAHYILNNPTRAKLVEDWRGYDYAGCCIPGYPELSVKHMDYWTRFWRCYNFLVQHLDE